MESKIQSIIEDSIIVLAQIKPEELKFVRGVPTGFKKNLI
tara:strand:- start:2949 stop:3068 length:120 start_codon:yes stop_codon:yes gene_type:complete